MPPASRFHHTHTHMLYRLLVAAAVAMIAFPAAAQTATQSVSVTVPEVELIDVASGSVSMTFTAPNAGDAFADATAQSSYAITVNTTNNKITGVLDNDYATGVTLAVSLAAPAGASSQGSQDLSTTAVDLVTDVATINASSLSIDYTASATSEAEPATESNTVTFTITDQ